eukprot:756863-Karenia_brevis.AAC.1
MTGPRAKAHPKATSMKEVRRGTHPKLHVGMIGPRADPKVTSMNVMRRGNDLKLHFGVTGPRGP